MNPYADPCELQSIGFRLAAPKPRIRKRFGIWVCVTAIPFVFGDSYDPKDAYDEWRSLYCKSLGVTDN